MIHVVGTSTSFFSSLFGASESRVRGEIEALLLNSLLTECVERGALDPTEQPEAPFARDENDSPLVFVVVTDLTLFASVLGEWRSKHRNFDVVIETVPDQPYLVLCYAKPLEVYRC